MKKLVSAALSLAMCLSPLTSTSISAVAAGEGSAAEEAALSADTFDAEKFFVVVGTYGGNTQLKYMYPYDNDTYGSDKVVLSKRYNEYSYGDVLVADGKPEMERVQSSPDNPVYMMAYHYVLNNESVLNKVGTCDELMEKKKLTITSNIYDGSSHFSIHLADEDGNAYYYGYSAFGSSLGVNANGEAGDTYIYAFNDGKLVIPLEKLEADETETTTTTTDTSLPDPDDSRGEDITWELKDGVLTIYGTGAMNDYWQSPFSGDEYEEAVISDGITRIGVNTFASVGLSIEPPSKLARVSIPDSVTSIGDWAFYGCLELKEAIIPESVTEMGKDVFGNCPELTIKGAAGSYAEAYAKENNIPFEAVSGTSDTTTTTTTAITTTTYPETTVTVISTHETFEFSEVLSYPTKKNYKTGEELDLEGLRFTGVSNADGSTREYEYSDYVMQDSTITITDKDGTSVERGDFSKLPAGSYTVNIKGEAGSYYAYNLCNNVDISFDVTVNGEAEPGKRVPDFIVSVVDKKSGKPVNDAVVMCNHYLETVANGQTVYSGPIVEIDTSKSNPFTVKGKKDINIQRLENFHMTEDSGYTLKEKDIETTEKDGNVYITLKVESRKNTSDTSVTGDANCDGEVNMADAVLIMQSISNPDKYTITEQGQKNADIDGSGDVTNNDALKIQQFKLNIIESLK